jgi:hypothetical protein
MGDKSFIWEYVRSCTTGHPSFPDCGPLWQLSAIGTLLVLAVITFFILVVVRVQQESRLVSL